METLRQTPMRLLALATVIAFCSLPAAATAQPEPPEGAEAGKIIFDTICASCHGRNARGNGPVADRLKTPPANLRLIAARRGGSLSPEKLAAFIDGRADIKEHGPREMPIWGDSLATLVAEPVEREARIDRAIELVVEYLLTIQE